MIVDTSALLAFFDSSEPTHEAVSEAVESTSEPLVVSPFVVAELDYIVLTRHGSRAEALVLDELSSDPGNWRRSTSPGSRPRRRSSSSTPTYRSASPTPSNIVLADAYQTRTIATLDRRHFSILRLRTEPRLLLCREATAFTASMATPLL